MNAFGIVTFNNKAYFFLVFDNFVIQIADLYLLSFYCQLIL